MATVEAVDVAARMAIVVAEALIAMVMEATTTRGEEAGIEKLFKKIGANRQLEMTDWNGRLRDLICFEAQGILLYGVFVFYLQRSVRGSQHRN